MFAVVRVVPGRRGERPAPPAVPLLVYRVVRWPLLEQQARRSAPAAVRVHVQGCRRVLVFGLLRITAPLMSAPRVNSNVTIATSRTPWQLAEECSRSSSWRASRTLASSTRSSLAGVRRRMQTVPHRFPACRWPRREQCWTISRLIENGGLVQWNVSMYDSEVRQFGCGNSCFTVATSLSRSRLEQLVAEVTAPRNNHHTRPHPNALNMRTLLTNKGCHSPSLPLEKIA